MRWYIIFFMYFYIPPLSILYTYWYNPDYDIGFSDNESIYEYDEDDR